MSDDNNMPPFCKEFNSFQKDEAYQRKLYFLNEKLQIMVRELPLKYQQRIPNELLCSLAESLADNTVFGIVNSLMDIQHVTEKQLFQQRLQFTANQSSAMQKLMEENIDNPEKEIQRAALETKHREELKEYDKKVILELDRKVHDQQRILDMAGVPGFDITDDPMKIQVQIRLLDFILRLSQMDIS
ncbi:hypothetical protein LSTR_LSTR006298 [Laodelphax striatellus]|uniref:Protein DGCR6 n=1 Tax=Laodelphax striatellus TaxID=195883 RepID=A0A482X526_LAOST|nr:hypothetical protein LSTR_LSTR006298 [Laodelphax striatellus]